MNCESFDRWLDADQAPLEAESMLAHARDCARCARALAAARALEAALREPVAAPAASADFTAAVMSRIEARPAAAVEPLRLPPVWLQVLRDPATITGALIAALVLANLRALEIVIQWLMVRAQTAWSAVDLSLPTRSLGQWQELSTPTTAWLLVTVALSVVVPASWWLYRESQHWFAPRVRWR